MSTSLQWPVSPWLASSKREIEVKELALLLVNLGVANKLYTKLQRLGRIEFLLYKVYLDIIITYSYTGFLFLFSLPGLLTVISPSYFQSNPQSSIIAILASPLLGFLFFILFYFFLRSSVLVFCCCCDKHLRE